MKKIISLILISCFFSGCALFRTHKPDIEQGNIITQEEVGRLHLGMSEFQVKEVMGTPLLVNVFTPNRVEYVYTFQAGHGERQDKRLVCLFSNGRLREIVR